MKEIEGNRIRVRVTRKIGMKHFSNVDLSASVDVELDDPEDIEEQCNALFDTLENLVQDRCGEYEGK